MLQHYDVLSSNGVEKLILPLSDKNPDIKYYCSVEDLFDKLYEAHINIGHGGRDRMIKELKRQYKNIKQKEINLFLNLCEICHKIVQSLKELLPELKFVHGKPRHSQS